jgi:hypothetical protein
MQYSDDHSALASGWPAHCPSVGCVLARCIARFDSACRRVAYVIVPRMQRYAARYLEGSLVAVGGEVTHVLTVTCQAQLLTHAKIDKTSSTLLQAAFNRDQRALSGGHCLQMGDR